MFHLMRAVRRALPMGAVGAAILLVATTASATIARFLPLDEHLALSTLVVRAQVGDQRTFTGDDGRPRTETSLAILETYKGPLGVGNEIHVRQMQGRVGEDGFLRIPGDPVFRPGEEVIVFVRKDDKGVHFLTAMGQSKYDVIRSADGATVLRDLGGFGFYVQESEEKVLHAPTEAPEPLSVCGATLRDLVAAKK